MAVCQRTRRRSDSGGEEPADDGRWGMKEITEGSWGYERDWGREIGMRERGLT